MKEKDELRWGLTDYHIHHTNEDCTILETHNKVLSFRSKRLCFGKEQMSVYGRSQESFNSR